MSASLSKERFSNDTSNFLYDYRRGHGVLVDFGLAEVCLYL